MSKPNSAAQAQSQRVAAFDLAKWGESLRAAAFNVESGAKRLLDLALEARGLVEPDTAREKFADAFAAAIVATHHVTDEEARASKSLKNRVSDAMAVFKCEALPASLPNNLQRAADAVRKANPKPRAPRQPVAPKVQASDVNPLALLQAALEALRSQCKDNATALELVGELVDLSSDLAECLAAEATDLEEKAA